MPTCASPKGSSLQLNPEGSLLPRDLEEIVAWTKSCAGFSPMSLAQKDQLLEIGSRVRLGKPIICGRLSVSRDKSQTFWAHEVRTNLLFTMSNRTGGKAKKLPANFFRMTLDHRFSSLLNTPPSREKKRQSLRIALRTILADCTEMVEPDGIEPTTSCLQSRRSPS